MKDSVNAYVVNLNTHPAYLSFRKSRAQLRKADQEVTASTMIHKAERLFHPGQRYNNYLFAMYQITSDLSPPICNPNNAFHWKAFSFYIMTSLWRS